MDTDMQPQVTPPLNKPKESPRITIVVTGDIGNTFAIQNHYPARENLFDVQELHKTPLFQIVACFGSRLTLGLLSPPMPVIGFKPAFNIFAVTQTVDFVTQFPEFFVDYRCWRITWFYLQVGTHRQRDTTQKYNQQKHPLSGVFHVQAD